MSESDQRYRSPRPQAKIVICTVCSKTWYYACDECAELFADYHRKEFEHKVFIDDRYKVYDYDKPIWRSHRRRPWE